MKQNQIKFCQIKNNFNEKKFLNYRHFFILIVIYKLSRN